MPTTTCRCHRARLDAAVHRPNDLRSLDDIQRLPFTRQDRPARPLPVRLVRAAAREPRATARVIGNDGQTDRRRLHRADLDTWADLMARSLACARRAAGRSGPQRVRLRAVHRRPGRALRCGAARRHRRADVGRIDRAADCADRGLSARACCARRRPMRWRLPRWPNSRASTCAKSALEVGLFGAEPWSDAMRQRDRGAAGPQGDRHLRAVGDHGTRGRLRMRVSGRPARLGGPFPVRGDRSGDRTRGARGRRPGELVITTLTKEALPMLRYRTRDITQVTTRPLRLRPHALAHSAHHGTQRRHADHPRRQRVSVAGRGGAHRLAATSRRITSSSSSAAAASTT